MGGNLYAAAAGMAHLVESCGYLIEAFPGLPSLTVPALRLAGRGSRTSMPSRAQSRPYGLKASRRCLGSRVASGHDPH
jgi:hypothetical protein